MTAPLRGATYRAKKRSWLAKLSHKNKTIALGSYKTELEAGWAYDVAAKYLRGPDAVLNFPRGEAPLAIRARVAAALIRRGLIEP